MRPVLISPSRRLWRDPTSLQLGRAENAVVLDGLDSGDRAVLAMLDGTRDVGEVLAAAVKAGSSRERTQDLLALLTGAGLVSDATERWPERLSVVERDRLDGDVEALSLLHGGHGLPALRRRDAARVLVVGAGRVGAAVAALLAGAGVGGVDVQDDGTVRPQDLAGGGLTIDDVGRNRGDAARELVQRVSPSNHTGPSPRPDLVLLTPTYAPDDRLVAALRHVGVAHLLAEVRDTVGVVGPLVVPGRTACLRCQDLTRTDRDPGWPLVAVQLSGRVHPGAGCDGVLAAAVAAQAALQALTLLDGQAPATVDGTVELALPDWRWRRRSWPAHPGCGCVVDAA